MRKMMMTRILRMRMKRCMTEMHILSRLECSVRFVREER